MNRGSKAYLLRPSFFARIGSRCKQMAHTSCSQYPICTSCSIRQQQTASGGLRGGRAAASEGASNLEKNWKDSLFQEDEGNNKKDWRMIWIDYTFSNKGSGDDFGSELHGPYNHHWTLCTSRRHSYQGVLSNRQWGRRPFWRYEKA